MHTSQPKIQLPHIRGNVYKYGEAVSYRFELLRADDYDDLQLFQCGNEKLNNHIKSGVIQNDMIIGAVTHVVVDDCTKGYGIFITNMLEEAEN